MPDSLKPLNDYAVNASGTELWIILSPNESLWKKSQANNSWKAFALQKGLEPYLGICTIRRQILETCPRFIKIVTKEEGINEGKLMWLHLDLVVSRLT